MTPWCIKVLEVIRSKKNVLLAVVQLLEEGRNGGRIKVEMKVDPQK
jgi:hypothetical protein